MAKFLLCACLALAAMPALAQATMASSPPAAAAPSPTSIASAGAKVGAARTAASADAAAADVADAGDAADAADAALQEQAPALAAQLDALLAPSRAPRDQALRWELGRWRPGMGTITATPAVSLRDAATRGATDRLVQWLWARATPAESGCVDARPCPGRAHALATLEPGNGAAWLPVLEQAWDDENDAAMEAALSRMAKAQAFDDLFIEYAGALAEVENRFPAYLAARSAVLAGSARVDSSDVASIVSAIARSAASAIPSMMTLVNVCDRGKHPEAPATRFARCGAIGHLMLGEATSLQSRVIGLAILRRSGQLTAQDELASRRLRWTAKQSADLDLEDPAELRRYFSDLLRTNGEVAAMERQLARAGKPAQPPAGWMAPGED